MASGLSGIRKRSRVSFRGAERSLRLRSQACITSLPAIEHLAHSAAHFYAASGQNCCYLCTAHIHTCYIKERYISSRISIVLVYLLAKRLEEELLLRTAQNIPNVVVSLRHNTIHARLDCFHHSHAQTLLLLLVVIVTIAKR